jgi:hypothetical protein
LVTCPQCQWRLSADLADTRGEALCPRCRRAFTATLFPALFRTFEGGRPGEHIAEGSQAACFFHASRRAVVACDLCGRFLCTLCDLPVGGRHACPTCLAEGTETQSLPALGSARRQTVLLYDNIALALAVLPLPCWYFTALTAPVALFVVLRYWNRSASPVPRGRGRFVLAATLALLQIAGWMALVVTLAKAFV